MVSQRAGGNEHGAGRHRHRSVGDLTALLVAAVALTIAVVRLHHAGQTPFPFRRAVPVDAIAELRTEPARFGPLVRVTASVGGDVVDILAFGARARQLERRSAGELIHIIGAVEGKSSPHLRLIAITDWAPGSPLARSANRVRATMAAGVSNLAPDDRSLFLGLVLGDDRGQRAETVAAFRRAGLSHLTAVSGQNVAYMLVLLGPLLTRMTSGRRWLATALVIGWFAVLTRLEPSVLRASAMAVIALTGRSLGREVRPVRLVSLTIAAIAAATPHVLTEPGLWLSLSATAGLLFLGPSLSRRIPAPPALATALGTTLAAQLGVLPVQLALFGVPSPVSIPANLLAGPVAGLVMVWGLPAGIVAGLVRPLSGRAADLVTVPALIGVRWVAWVAHVAAAVPTPLAWVALVAAACWAMARLRSSPDGFAAPREGIR